MWIFFQKLNCDTKLYCSVWVDNDPEDEKINPAMGY